ncbi:PP-loop family protein [Babesia ovata]|uniref:Cytoplasmic tRNA 2-thiolation protein 1 n=1 Tax=Babesia ovata TaxID=189622 RepID=A0A2H6K862_9APIC|nr:PP-loop family protein [Babesia ovata]GBE59192.1 PP-loop family protein [Babesia ovata]
MKCASCLVERPALRRSVNRLPYCKKCFVEAFEDEVYQVIQEQKLIEDGDVVCIGVSGGKDSSVLAHVLATLKERYKRNWTLVLLAADEGIRGYRDDSLNVVMNMKNPNYNELMILNFKDRFGFTMDEIVALIGQKNNCTVCGTFRRQILEIGARLLGANKLCTGHNLDDNAETTLLNFCRNDLFKLAKSLNERENTSIAADLPCEHNAESRQHEESKVNNANGTPFTRIKPMMYCYEKEIVMYARYLKLEYFSTECSYAPEAYRGYMRTFIKQLEAVDPRIIQNIAHSSQHLYAHYPTNRQLKMCKKCGIEGLNDLCKACITVEKLSSLAKKSQDG